MQHLSLIDCHVHSEFSADSQMSISQGCEHALQQGLAGIIITDHVDIDHPSTKHHFAVDFEQRRSVINKIKETLPLDFKLLQGVEIGFQSHIVDQLVPSFSLHHLDFVLCSVHVLDRRDFWDASYYEHKTKQEAYERYLQAIYASITQWNDFDVIAHIGYMSRYVPYEDKKIYHHDHADILDAIFLALIERGKGIEINTSGAYYHLDPTIPHVDLVKRYKELGGEIITIGSDAHDALQIGRNFTYACDMLKTLGFSYVTYFKERMPMFVAL